MRTAPKVIFILNLVSLRTKHHKFFGKDGSYNMVTGVQQELSHSSPGTPSAKQKKARSTSQPQFRSENTTATIEADELLLGLQQLALKQQFSQFQQQDQ